MIEAQKVTIKKYGAAEDMHFENFEMAPPMYLENQTVTRRSGASITHGRRFVFTASQSKGTHVNIETLMLHTSTLYSSASSSIIDSHRLHE